MMRERIPIKGGWNKEGLCWLVVDSFCSSCLSNRRAWLLDGKMCQLT